MGEPMLKQENHGLSQAEELVRDENGLPYETHLHGRERSARQTSQTLADESQKLRGAYVGAVFNIPVGGAQQQLQQEEEGLVGEDDNGGDDEVDVPKEIEDDDRSSGLIFSAHHTSSWRHGKTALRETPAADTKSVASAAKEEVQRSRMVSQAVSADRTWEAQEGLTPSTQQLEEDESNLAGNASAGEEQDEQDETPLDFTGAQTFAVDGQDGGTEDVALPREAEDEQRSAGLIFSARRGNGASDQAGNVERKIKSQLQRVRQKIFEDRIKEREAARRVSNAHFRAARTLSTDTPPDGQIFDPTVEADDTHSHQMSSLHADEVSSRTTSKGPSLPKASFEQQARATAKAQATSTALGFRSAGALFRHLQHVEALKDKRRAVARYSSKLPGVALQGAQQTFL